MSRYCLNYCIRKFLMLSNTLHSIILPCDYCIVSYMYMLLFDMTCFTVYIQSLHTTVHSYRVLDVYFVFPGKCIPVEVSSFVVWCSRITLHLNKSNIVCPGIVFFYQLYLFYYQPVLTANKVVYYTYKYFLTKKNRKYWFNRRMKRGCWAWIIEMCEITIYRVERFCFFNLVLSRLFNWVGGMRWYSRCCSLPATQTTYLEHRFCVWRYVRVNQPKTIALMSF